ncbi:MAG TPA: hypothetical protein VH231_03435 [Solirubrobacteraceae bacterium]|nr:hypothetical protein [Solirubrobacteraceae bacterium]
MGRGSWPGRSLPGRRGCGLGADGGTRAHTRRDDAPEGALVRVRQGGEVLDRVEHDRAIFAATLGGQDGATLFLLAAEWRDIEHVDEAVAARTGQVLPTKAPSPGAGWP